MTTWIVLFVVAAIVWFFVELAPINMRAKQVGKIIAGIIAAIGAIFFVLWLVVFIDHGTAHDDIDVDGMVSSQWG